MNSIVDSYPDNESDRNELLRYTLLNSTVLKIPVFKSGNNRYGYSC